MGGMTNLAEQIDASISVRGAELESRLFGTGDPYAVAAILEEFLAAALAPVVSTRHYAASVGTVAIVDLDDGTRAVLKVHRWNTSVARLAAVQRVQVRAREHGISAPRPLLEPTPLLGGVATVEEFLPGEIRSGRDAVVRGTLASQLHRVVEVARPLVGVLDVGPAEPTLAAGDALWGEPHDVKFDFEASSTGAEWIDELARSARDRLVPLDEPLVIGHCDWRVEHVGFDGDRVVAIYDWDSLALVSEPDMVGKAAAQFSINWRLHDHERDVEFPTIGDMQAFVRDYEAARGVPFTASQLEALDAANLALMCYGARCQHSLLVSSPEIGVPRDAWWIGALRARPERVFG
jgi:hypothetical protein